MKFRNTVTGLVVISNSDISGAMWEPINDSPAPQKKEKKVTKKTNTKEDTK